MKYLIIILSFVIFANVFADEVLPPDLKKGRRSSVFANKVMVRLKAGYDIFRKDDILIKNNTKRVNFLLHPSSSITYNNKMLEKLSPDLQTIKAYKAEEKILRTFIVYYDGETNPEDYCKQLMLSNPAVEIAEPYYVPEFLSYLPDDTHIPNQDANLRLIKAYEAWAIEKGSPDIIIGISDSGTNQDHEDISGNIGINESEIPDDGIDNDGNGYIDDYAGYDFAWQTTGSAYPGDTFNNSDTHGQQVAGIAGATTDNGIGIAGIAFNSRIFPLKIIEGNTLKYAYESIIYAAVRGFKVINCSWGVVKPFSDIDQSIIDFAVSRDVSIVAAAGNTSTRANKYDLFYPSGYYGVLGVGEVNSNDRLVGSSSISAGSRILAPGDGNFTTTNFGYSVCDGGTSFAAPVVAGAVALARSKYPQLNALQALEFVRQSVDKHDNFSNNDKLLIPGRLNLEKAVSNDPFSIPAILPHAISYFDSEGLETDRFKAGDDISIVINAKNILGNTSNLRFTLQIAYDPASSIVIIDSVQNIEAISSGQDIILDKFKLRISQNYSGYTILRVNITSNSGYSDFFKFNFVPAKDISTFANDEIKFSMSDIGEFGYSTNTATVSGIGFAYRNLGNQIYRNSSVMLSASPNKVVYNANIGKIYNFTAIKGFVPPDRYNAVYEDANGGSNRIGVEVDHKIEFLTSNSKAARMEFSLKNKSGNIIEDASFGLYIDWDIGSNPENNRTKLLLNAIPEEFSANSVAAQAVYVDDNFPYFGSAAYSDFPNVEAQSAGLDNSMISSFDRPQRYQALNSGKSIQSKIVSDMGGLTGIKFPGAWEPGETRNCVICIGAGDNEDELSSELKKCLTGVTSVNKNSIVKSNDVIIFPNPAREVLYFETSEHLYSVEYSLIDILGRQVILPENIREFFPGERIGLDLSNINSGIYILKILSNNSIIHKQIQILK
ncbi:MAG: S8 family peptidase [Candidatus Kapabacteria bacterium]|nr:S8 family peptidase [Ignavibacteriota bacterium]MCW5883562.1 S8 family peptidase [Candidatus Kapabacteria bacterium]